MLYNGEWKNNKYHGVGIEEGNTFYYEGCFQNGKREGLGCYYDYETQQSFIGNWVNGYKEGKFCVKNLFTGEYSVKTFNEWSNLWVLQTLDITIFYISLCLYIISFNENIL